MNLFIQTRGYNFLSYPEQLSLKLVCKQLYYNFNPKQPRYIKYIKNWGSIRQVTYTKLWRNVFDYDYSYRNNDPEYMLSFVHKFECEKRYDTVIIPTMNTYIDKKYLEHIQPHNGLLLEIAAISNSKKLFISVYKKVRYILDREEYIEIAIVQAYQRGHLDILKYVYGSVKYPRKRNYSYGKNDWMTSSIYNRYFHIIEWLATILPANEKTPYVYEHLYSLYHDNRTEYDYCCKLLSFFQNNGWQITKEQAKCVIYPEDHYPFDFIPFQDYLLPKIKPKIKTIPKLLFKLNTR
jgi:hypothetical protein